jgi:hypothetical protein
VKHRKFARILFDHYKSPMLSLDVSDAFGACQCEPCEGTTQLERGLNGALSEHVWGCVNRPARDLYKTHPSHQVSGLSYGRYRMPPEKIDRPTLNELLKWSLDSPNHEATNWTATFQRSSSIDTSQSTVCH